MRRRPDEIIGGSEDPCLLRWHLWKRRRTGSGFLHLFLRDDDPRALHDHPWASLSVVLRGGYFELTPAPDGTLERRWYGAGRVILRRDAARPHRIELARDRDGGRRPCLTLFLTGPVVPQWGFHCPQGWVPWRRYVAPDRDSASGRIGRGCD